ncbi:MAG: Omp28-related outer membrane protein [Saprospiraceae bacterium]|nr:Omp28-related outer membrane protein [Saprospiraceae bacterium]
MKKILVFMLLFGAFSPAFGQVTAKKYLLIEHFTNSNCGVCASKNPTFFNLINQAQYADDVHHVAIHPMFPYPSCVFYQANTAENTAWTGLYPVSGTPTIVLNGAIQNPSTPILTEAKLLTYLNQTSPLHLKVTETGPANARQVKITAKALDAIPAGNYKLHVAVVEKKINQQTGNGETVHHNVFRKMLTAVNGNTFTVPALGETEEYEFSYSVANNWNVDEVYVLAFVKEADTKVVLNSGTRFDPVLTDSEDPASKQVQVYPNPVSGTAIVDLAVDQAVSVELFSINGQKCELSYHSQGSIITLDTQHLPTGTYLVKATGTQGIYVGKFVKH